PAPVGVAAGALAGDQPIRRRGPGPGNGLVQRLLLGSGVGEAKVGGAVADELPLLGGETDQEPLGAAGLQLVAGHGSDEITVIRDGGGVVTGAAGGDQEGGRQSGNGRADGVHEFIPWGRWDRRRRWRWRPLAT